MPHAAKKCIHTASVIRKKTMSSGNSRLPPGTPLFAMLLTDPKQFEKRGIENTTRIIKAQ